MSKPFYITTTLPYVNAAPHIGFALEIVQADILARYHHLLGDKVFFNTGTDEHGLKIHRKSQELGQNTQDYVNEYAAKFQILKEKLNLYDDLIFIRTTDTHHKAAAQEFWRRCKANGDIYKKNYQVKYCVGCELEKTESELNDQGRCPIHPNMDIELIEEENWFFNWKKYQEPLLKFYSEHPDFVVPSYRFNEIKKFVESGLQDFSISRVKAKMPWGIAVPDDEDQVMYVWFDALVNYVSTLGWPEDEGKFKEFWGTQEHPNAFQVAGKDNLRQQSAMWQAMLMSAGLPPTKQILIHGFITSGGQKMSKSLGNVVDPYAIIEEYGTDALRYFLARHINPFEDSDFTMDRFREVYNADLVNGIGNLTARVMTMAAAHLPGPIEMMESVKSDPRISLHMDTFEFNLAVQSIWERIGHNDALITLEKPFSKIKSESAEDRKAALDVIKKLVSELYVIATDLEPFMPATSDIIKNAIKENKKPENMFPRKA